MDFSQKLNYYKNKCRGQQLVLINMHTLTERKQTGTDEKCGDELQSCSILKIRMFKSFNVAQTV